MSDNTVIRERRSEAAARMMGCVALVAVSIWLATASPAVPLSASRQLSVRVIGIASGLFFGVMIARFGWAFIRPGTLSISTNGLLQDLGWRKVRWNWSDIKDIKVVRTAGNLATVCLVYPKSGWPVRLFGWEISPTAIGQITERYRQASTLQK